MLCPIMPGPSNASAAPSSGGTAARLLHTTSPTMSIAPACLATRLPPAQLSAAAVVHALKERVDSGAAAISSMKLSQIDAPAFPTTVGWDFATGLGSVNAYNLVMGWPKN